MYFICNLSLFDYFVNLCFLFFNKKSQFLENDAGCLQNKARCASKRGISTG
ncbi:hypothetical protein PROPEN_01926 [Proteus penneri ATCC 35198]|nr:hypothetical protein PROPEN_01926 [Proteus penneri ATCC 35198]